MEKEFVPYEIALALKELGFDNENDFFGYYKIETQELRTGVKYSWFEGKDMVMHFRCHYYITAPVYQQAFRWFREKYNLNAQIFLDWGTYYFSIAEVTEKSKVKHYDDDYGTYEEAEKECLNKLIELCKKS